MPRFAIATCCSFGGSKGALYRETLQATGFDMGRVVIATAEFAPMLHAFYRFTPAVIVPTAIGCVF
jgi:hypothetical protein